MSYITLEVKDNIGIVTLNHPPINALTIDIYNDIKAAFRSINYRDDVRVAILRAEGKHFAAGNDLEVVKNLTQSLMDEYTDGIKNAAGAVADCRVPVIAAINGAALGAGLAIVSCCDIIIASEKASFGIPEVKIGIIGAAGFLKLLVPKNVVNYMALTGDALTAEAMMKYGAVHQVVPHEQLMDASLEMAKKLLGNSPLIQEYWKKALRINADARLIEQYDVEMVFSGDATKSEDFHEALTAFLERRKPEYKWK